ncbi:MAG: EamA-like transporter family protein [Firmicutes bacterium ADurb.Bin506]|nr:MAG: EamA-like transporter family protein [Firmicutes bacterium ADurb.Bin506]
MRSPLRRAREFMVLNVLSNSAANIIQRLALSLVSSTAVTSIQVWTTLLVSLAIRLFYAAVRRRATSATAAASAADADADSAAPLAQQAAKPVARPGELWHFAVAGLIGQVAGNYAFLAAAKAGGIGFTVAVAQTWGLWAIILGLLVLGEKAGRRLAIGLPVALAGILLLSAQGQGISDLTTYLSSGLPWALLASLSWAVSSVLIRRGLSRGCDQQVGLIVQFATPSAVLAVAAIGNPAPMTGLNASTVAMIAAAGILSGTLAMQFLYRALSMCPLSQVMLINASYPAVVNVLSWLFLGESLTVRGIVGIALITAACVWTQTEPPGADK